MGAGEIAPRSVGEGGEVVGVGEGVGEEVGEGSGDDVSLGDEVPGGEGGGDGAVGGGDEVVGVGDAGGDVGASALDEVAVGGGLVTGCQAETSGISERGGAAAARVEVRVARRAKVRALAMGAMGRVMGSFEGMGAASTRAERRGGGGPRGAGSGGRAR